MTLTVKKEMDFEEFLANYSDLLPDSEYRNEFARDIYDYLSDLDEENFTITEEFLEEFLNNFIEYDENELVKEYNEDSLPPVLHYFDDFGILYFQYIDEATSKQIFFVED